MTQFFLFRDNLNGFIGLDIFNGQDFNAYVANEEFFCLENKADRSYYWSHLSTFIAVMFGTLAVLILIGSVTDIFGLLFSSFEDDKEPRPRSFGKKLILSFSIPSNFMSIMSTKTGSKDTLTCLNGLRFISMTWVLMGHSFAYINVTNMRNANRFADVLYGKLGLSFDAVLNALPSVDSFFLLR